MQAPQFCQTPLKSAFLLLVILAVGAALSSTSKVMAAPSITDYGKLATIRNMSISPNGQHYAWLQEEGDEKMMIVYNNQDGSRMGIRTGDEMKTRDVEFATNDYVILHASDTRMQFGYFGTFEYSGAFSFSLKTQKTKPLLRDTKGLHPAQEGLGRIIGVDPASNTAFMPAHDNSTKSKYNLYKVSLKSGRGKLFGRGSWRTIDWFVDSQGELLAREDFDHERGKHIFYSYLSGKAQEIYSYDSKLPNISVQAVAADEKHLLFIQDNGKGETVHALSLSDGSISDVLYAKEDKEIDYLITDKNRKIISVKYSGFLPSYQFEHKPAQSSIEQITQLFPASAVDLMGKSDDNQHFLVRISGNTAPNAFYAFDNVKKQLRLLTTGYKGLTSDDLGEVMAFRYSARDGLKIPAILTWPAGKQEAQQRKNLPLIVLPHGGPNAYDAVGFDWLAQFFSHKGYLVLQPNFRGSTGFGNDFHSAGSGRWGKEMQDDITDGVNYLTQKGIADKNKVCIIGASYGGYAALAGGAFTPDLYRCVVAINGVSDIHAEIKKDISQSSQKTWLRNYWEMVFGEDKNAFKQLDQVSPYFFADKFSAPTLIIYSKDDTIVSPNQSKKMHRALNKANKDSTLVALKGEDHWLSTSKMRLELLQTLDSYLDRHNPVN